MAIGFFLPLLDGESIYSGVARQCKYTGINMRQLSQRFFNGVNQPINQRLPNNLEAFIGNLTGISDLNVCEAICKHTLFRIYSSTLDDEKSNILYSAMTSGTESIHRQLIDASASKFYYCCECIQDDNYRYGESYWHISHTIPFIQICPTHNCFLTEWEVPIEKIKTRNYHALDFIDIPQSKSRTVPSEVLVAAAKRFSEILDEDNKPNLTEFFEHAKELDFYIEKRNTYSLNQSLIGKYIQYLEKGNAIFAKTAKERPTIINRLFNGSTYKFNPQNLVFLKGFFTDLPRKKIKKELKTVSCCNKHCKLFGIEIQKENYTICSVLYNQEIGAKCKCQGCGIEFTMSLEPTSKYLTINNYGPLMRELISKGVNAGLSFRELEGRLNLDRKRISKIYSGNEFRIKKKAGPSFLELRSKRRAIWRIELNSNHFVSISESAKTKKTEYRWLIKFDSKWCKKINQKFRKYPEGRKPNVLTKKQQIQFKEKLNNIVKDLRSKKVLRQFSMTLFCSLLSKKDRTILSNYSDLNRYLKSFAESHFDFKLRKIDHFLRQNPTIKITKSFLFSKFKIPHSINGAKKKQLQGHLNSMII